MVDFRRAGALPVLHLGGAEPLAPALRKSECGSEQDEAGNLGMPGRIERGEIAAHARSDQGNRACAGRVLDHPQLTRDGEMLEISGREIGHVYGSAGVLEDAAEVARLAGGWSGGESVQVNDTDHFFTSEGESGISVNLISASVLNSLNGS